MSADWLEDLEVNALAAIRILEKERYHEFSFGLYELIRQAKHYQQLTESLLSTHVGIPREVNEDNLKRARDNNDWYRYGDE